MRTCTNPGKSNRTARC